jgi:hypothetical protein
MSVTAHRVQDPCSNSLTLVETFYINFQEYVSQDDPTTVIYYLPSSIVALKNKSVKIKYFTVDALNTTSFLFCPELTLKSPYLSNFIASYVPFKQNCTPFQDTYSINSNIVKLTFRLFSGGIFQQLADQINAYVVLDIIS